MAKKKKKKPGQLGNLQLAPSVPVVPDIPAVNLSKHMSLTKFALRVKETHQEGKTLNKKKLH